MEPLFELRISAAPKGSREISSHLFRQLRDAIVNRRLPPGTKMPSTRDALRLFGVSRNTAQNVYDRLIHEGLVTARHGSGTYVLGPLRNAAPTPALQASRQPASINGFWERPDIASWIGFWNDGSPQSVRPVAELRPALVDQRLFPHATFRRVMARQLRRLETAPRSSKSPQANQGNAELRHAIASHIGLTRAVACNGADVLVTSGAQQAFDLIARSLVVPGQTVVALEDPGYPPMRVPFAAAGADIVPVPVDAEGIVVDAIPTNAKIICACPSHQFPLGMPMSERRRHALLNFARAHGAVILEDDYDGEFRYDGSPLEALRGRMSANEVFYIGSFSKSMFPAIRLGFIVPPAWALPALVAAKNATDWHSSLPVQVAVACFIGEGHLARHIRRARHIYRERRGKLLELLNGRLRDSFTVVPSYYGMHVAIIASRDVDCEAASALLAGQGVMVHSLKRYFLNPPTRSGFVLGYAAADIDALTFAVEAIAQVTA